VQVLGEVADLADLYARAAVVVCPIEVGTGVKVKTLEAIRFGRAVVATPEAVAGLPEEGEPAWAAAADLEACAEATIDLLLDVRARTRLEDAAFAYGGRHLSFQRSLECVRGILPGRIARLLARVRRLHPGGFRRDLRGKGGAWQSTA
jgi:hypothetical protein